MARGQARGLAVFKTLLVSLWLHTNETGAEGQKDTDPTGLICTGSRRGIRCWIDRSLLPTVCGSKSQYPGDNFDRPR